MKERFMSLEGSLNVPVTFGTFHAVFLRYCVTHIIIQLIPLLREIYNIILSGTSL